MFTKPYLQPYKGISTRHECPSCGMKNCFTLYIDGNTNEPINSKVGKCNREIKCGYHFSPKQYFNDNPSEKKDGKENTSILKPRLIVSYKQIGEIPIHFINESLSDKSNFVHFLSGFMTIEEIQNVCKKYKLGATKTNEVIFWQIDRNGKVRTGKIMQYNHATGKRIKHENGSIDWIHNRLKKTKVLPIDFNLEQCFFGEHLLKLHPYSTVAIVESEKSAIIASSQIPNLIWLAAGNINGLSIDKCKILEGRNVILYPDLGAFNKWSIKADEIQKKCRCKVIISTLLEKIDNDSDRENGLDIADYIIEQLKNKKLI